MKINHSIYLNRITSTHWIPWQHNRRLFSWQVNDLIANWWCGKERWFDHLVMPSYNQKISIGFSVRVHVFNGMVFKLDKLCTHIDECYHKTFRFLNECAQHRLLPPFISCSSWIVIVATPVARTRTIPLLHSMDKIAARVSLVNLKKISPLICKQWKWNCSRLYFYFVFFSFWFERLEFCMIIKTCTCWPNFFIPYFAQFELQQKQNKRQNIWILRIRLTENIWGILICFDGVFHACLWWLMWIPNRTIQWRYNFYSFFLLKFTFFKNRLKRERFTVKIGARSIIIMTKKMSSKRQQKSKHYHNSNQHHSSNSNNAAKKRKEKKRNRLIKTIFQFRKCYAFRYSEYIKMHSADFSTD